jgi:hypothetical protein
MGPAHRMLPPAKEVAVVRNFITTEEQSALLDWAEDQFAGNHLKSNPAGPNRYFARYEENDPGVPGLFWRVRRRAVATFSVTDYEDEPRFKCFLGCNTEGGFIQEHRDPSPPGKRHVRMNIMLSKPLGGGRPVIEGKKLSVQERDLWCFYPTLMLHSSTPVTGNRKRFVLSIGILVPQISA